MRNADFRSLLSSDAFGVANALTVPPYNDVKPPMPGSPSNNTAAIALLTCHCCCREADMPVYKLEPIEGTQGHSDWWASSVPPRQFYYERAIRITLVKECI